VVAGLSAVAELRAGREERPTQRAERNGWQQAIADGSLAPTQRRSLTSSSTRSYANIADLDAGLMAIAAGILGANGKEGIIAAPGKLLGNQSPKIPRLPLGR